MATILLAAAGASIGSSFGGTLLGLSGAVLGRAAGATLGKSIDQRLLGTGSDAVDSGSIDRFHISGVGYGTPIKQVWGRMRIAGEVIWASRFMQSRNGAGTGKGSTGSKSNQATFTVSIAIALCRGEIQSIGRIWADGMEIPRNSIEFRVYTGSSDQLPDPKIEATEGAGFAPSYRGIAYVIIEDLSLLKFGNRVPQFSFEVIREAQSAPTGTEGRVSQNVRGVALIPGSGEYALATTPVQYNSSLSSSTTANVHTLTGETDFTVSLEQLVSDLPICNSVSLVVSWFGNDLRCANCSIRPKVEQNEIDPLEMPWIVSGQRRSTAQLVEKLDGKPVYGGTPADQSVIEAISALKDSGKDVMFYPFILMDQQAGNVLPDPWSVAIGQPVLPWRGRITLAKAPGLIGTSDQTTAAEIEIGQFLGSATLEDFAIVENAVIYSGSPSFGYRRFILHYAYLCKLAGGVESFCVGSELKGLTQVRSIGNTFPMVSALRQLASEVKSILGHSTKISYASDWSEYFGLHSNGDVFFNLDEFWSDANVDFIGIDNYMPITDWRDGEEHLDIDWQSIYNTNYLMSGLSGGEGFDWYYATPDAAVNQRRTPIVDELVGEHWVFRFKDLFGWWSNHHFDRVAGERSSNSSGWLPGMKPFRFTEYGCPALDKGTNEPNRFLDVKSSESGLPRDSNGLRDDYLQSIYINCIATFWGNVQNNPVALNYSGRMVDLDHCFLWAWDSRPYPEFPGNSEVWGDFENYDKGHWLNGRSTNQGIAAIVSDICQTGEFGKFIDVSELYGNSFGVTFLDTQTPRSKLQALAMAYNFDIFQSDGNYRFSSRRMSADFVLDMSKLVASSQSRSSIERVRSSVTDSVGRVRLGFVEAGNDFAVRSVEVSSAGSASFGSSEVDINIQLTDAAALSLVERWISEVSLSRDRVSLAIPISLTFLSVGTVFSFDGLKFRIERVDDGPSIILEAVLVDDTSNKAGSEVPRTVTRTTPRAASQVVASLLDLPLISGEEIAHSPRLAVCSSPWLGQISVWVSNFGPIVVANTVVEASAVMGWTESVLLPAPSGIWDRSSRFQLRVVGGELSSVSGLDVLNGANIAAIGDGSSGNWEVIQFSDVRLIAPETYEISGLLRGQAGTNLVQLNSWPIGSSFVLLDSSIPLINVSDAFRGLELTYYIGRSEGGYLGKEVLVKNAEFDGIGLRPYSVVHLGASYLVNGDILINWIRRSRFGGDSWASVEVPLGEEQEDYVVRVRSGSIVLREVSVTSPGWIYTLALQQLDGVSGALQVSVAQKSQSFGFGPFVEVDIFSG